MKDVDVRKALHDLLREHHEDDDTRVIDEMGVWSGTVRIDVAVLNGETCGFEIKSDADTLDRLPYQAEIYEKVFDKITLVVGKRHAKKSAEIVPKWWGVIVATDDGNGVQLKEKRRPKKNKNLDPEILVQLLWKDEAIALLAELGHARGWKGKRMRDIRAKLLELLSVESLATHVRQIVKRRENWLGQLTSNQLEVPVDG